MTLPIARLVKLLEDLLGQRLAQLDTPLIEAVDIPDSTLGKGEVLVVDDQGAELSRTNDAADEDRGRGSVAEEALVGDEVLRGTLSADLLVCLANHESLGLGKVVGSQHLLVDVAGGGVVGLGGQDEVGGDELCALVDELEERVLGVGARLAEEDGT